MLQRVAVCCSVLQCAAVCCSGLQCLWKITKVLTFAFLNQASAEHHQWPWLSLVPTLMQQEREVCCSVLRFVAVYFIMLQ